MAARMVLDVKVSNLRGVVANLYAADKRAQTAIKRVVRRNGVAEYEIGRGLCPVDTGFMRSQYRLQFTEQGYGYEHGFAEEDFTEAGEPPYYRFVVRGTRHMTGRDFLGAARDAQRPIFRRELSAEIRNAIARRRRARGAS